MARSPSIKITSSTSNHVDIGQRTFILCDGLRFWPSTLMRPCHVNSRLFVVLRGTRRCRMLDELISEGVVPADQHLGGGQRKRVVGNNPECAAKQPIARGNQGLANTSAPQSPGSLLGTGQATVTSCIDALHQYRNRPDIGAGRTDGSKERQVQLPDALLPWDSHAPHGALQTASISTASGSTPGCFAACGKIPEARTKKSAPDPSWYPGTWFNLADRAWTRSC